MGVFAVDVDGDADVDILAASMNDDTVAWYENDASQSFSGEEKESEPTSVVARCADEDAARWLASALSPFVNANARAGETMQSE